MEREHKQLTVEALRAAGCVFAEDEAELLIDAAAGPEQLAQLVQQRVLGMPIQYLLGWAEFRGIRIAVDEGVFVPRPRTEFLVVEAVKVVASGAVVVDLCCGAGAVGTAIAAEVSDIELHATDIDPAAVRCAQRNLVGRGEVHEGDLYAALPAALIGRVDVLVVNAPYVPTSEIELMPQEARRHESHVALNGGIDGLDIQRRVAADAGQWLVAGGYLLIETSRQQAPRTVEIVASGGLSAREARCDELDATVVIGRRGGHA